MHDLIQQYGSLRRLFEAYWTGRLTVEQERRVEDNNPKPDVYGMKPMPGKPVWYSDQWTPEERMEHERRLTAKS